jgi:hypothetical protein
MLDALYERVCVDGKVISQAADIAYVNERDHRRRRRRD